MRNLSLEKAKREYQSKVEKVAERLIRQGVPPWTAYGMAIEQISKKR